MPVIPIVICKNCTHRCDGKSLGNYNQVEYYAAGEDQEAEIMTLVQSKAKGLFICQKSAGWGQPHSKPDLELRSIHQSSKIVARLEVKHITRAFMQVENCLKRKKPPLAPLLPWEAIPVNTAKIRRYAKIYDEEGIPIHLVWRVDRACLPGKFFYQDIQTLISIVNRYGEKREFVRAGEDGDKTAFHYLVNELMPFDIDTYLDLLFPLRQATSPNTLLANADYDYPEYEYTDADAPPENL